MLVDATALWRYQACEADEQPVPDVAHVTHFPVAHCRQLLTLVAPAVEYLPIGHIVLPTVYVTLTLPVQ